MSEFCVVESVRDPETFQFDPADDQVIGPFESLEAAEQWVDIQYGVWEFERSYRILEISTPIVMARFQTAI